MVSYLYSPNFLLKILLVICYIKIKTLFSMLFYGVYLCSLLLNKQLPSKIKLLNLVLNAFFISLNFVVKESFTQALHWFFNHCIAYRNNIVSRRNIRAHPGARRGFLWSSSWLYWYNWSPKLQFRRAPAYWLYRHLYKQAPVHNPIVLNYAIYGYYLFVHLSYWSWMKTLDA